MDRDIEHIPEFFTQITVEKLGRAHPALLVRQMANHMNTLRAENEQLREQAEKYRLSMIELGDGWMACSTDLSALKADIEVLAEGILVAHKDYGKYNVTAYTDPNFETDLSRKPCVCKYCALAHKYKGE